MQPKVSIVSACYNKRDYIEEFFQSVYDQKWDNIELILVNDGSTDGTRDAIYEWEPKFKGRGFEVVIIDQENMGVSAAIKAGLERVSGDYFCVPDCDDILALEYVSRMVGILNDRPDFSRVVCDSDGGCWILSNSKGLKKNIITELSEVSFNQINAFFLSRVSSVLWRCMMRSAYIGQLIEALRIDFRKSQEPQTMVVLGYICGYIGKTAYLPESLYIFRRNTASGITTSLRECEDWLEFYKLYFDIAKSALNLLPLEKDVLNELINIANLELSFELMNQNFKFQRPEESGFSAVYEAMRSLKIPLRNASYSLENGRWRALERSFSNYFMGYVNPFQTSPFTPNRNGQIIGYGAYGVAAKKLLPLVTGSPLKPDVLWDSAAQDGPSEVMGIPVAKPDVSSLNANDTVLVFIRDKATAAEVYELLAASGTDNILYYFDILDYLADYYFPLRLD